MPPATTPFSSAAQAADAQPGWAGDADRDLLQRLAQGERGAFADLMRRHNRRLYRVARSILRDDAEAEDALQDAYLLAYRALPDFRGQSSLSTWLTRIVMNAALGRLRKAGRQAQIIELGVEPDSVQGQHSEEPMSRQFEQPERSLLRAQTRRLIEAKIDTLPEAFRTVFVLRALEELGVDETAVMLDIPQATVRTRYFRARAMLREALAREIDGAFDDAFAFDGARCDRIVRQVMARLGELPPA